MTTTHSGAILSSDSYFHVTDLSGLNAAIRAIGVGFGAADGTAFTIDLDLPHGTLTLDSELLAINLAAGTSLTLLGNDATLDGAGWQRGLFVQAGTVTIQGLTIANTYAAGGTGGDGMYGGGGGAGLGGGLFVGAEGVVTLRAVNFTGNQAVGGRGADATGTGAGGGGGLGGDGGDGSGPAGISFGGDAPTGFGGGGGVGLAATGGSLEGAGTGSAGIVSGGDSGGRGSDFQAAGAEGGGGGTGRLANFLSMAGGGGVGGHDGGKTDPDRSWGTGGFGGGGGGTLGTYGGTVGGFGGGAGGSLLYNGRGGFGGGGGGSALALGAGQSAGFGAGLGGTDLLGAGGGGGLGAGGAVFVQQGGSLVVEGGLITGGIASGGAGGTGAGADGGAGQGLGSGIFLHGGQVITLAGLAGGTLTIDDVIAEGPVGAGVGHAGLIIAAGGTVSLGAANSFGGGILVQDAAILRLGHAAAAGTGPVRFAAGAQAQLVIEGLASPAGVLEGVTDTTTITLRAIATASASATLEQGNLLRVGDGVNSMVLRLDPALDLSGLNVALAADSAGGTAVTLHGMPNPGVPCFRNGTAIATPWGEVAVERLQVGDVVLTRQGQPRHVRWIGRREVSAGEMAERAELRPVLVRRGALAEGVPARDLFVSPLHALLAGGVLVPAAALVNGRSILRVAPPGGMQYCHVELDDQALVLAEGTPAETFLDQASRAIFHNAASYAALDIDPARAPAPLAVPRVEGGYRVEAIRRALARRAGLPPLAWQPGALSFHVERRDDTMVEGWAFDPVRPDSPVELELRHDRSVVARGLADRYRADLDRAALAGGRCAFRLALPPGIDASGLSLHRARDGTRLDAA